jgi:serine/threonine-protein kinase
MGEVVAGYLLIRQLGQGGFGTAYLAAKDGQEFVIKLLRVDATTVTLERFDREIRSLRKVNHALVARYVDHGEVSGPEGPRKFLVMPYRPGRTLFDVVQLEPVWKPERIVNLVRDILAALEAIHDQDIVHRDVKPKNIWVGDDGRAMLLDLGIAKLLDYSSITQGMAPLTWRYASPEQALETVDARSDLYSLGVVMYELLTGRPVFDPADPFTFLKRLREDMPDLPSYYNPGIPTSLENLVMRLLAKQPHQRPTSAKAVLVALDDMDEDEPDPSSATDTGVGPKYFVHVQHNEAEPLRIFLKSGGHLSGVVYGASQLLSSKGPIGVALNEGVPILVDPETHRLARSDFSRTAGLRTLPWVTDPMTPIKTSDFASVDDYQRLSKSVVDFQLKEGASRVCAPYFHFPDLDSEWLKRNQKLVREGRAALDASHSRAELFAVISTDIETICDDAARQTLMNIYTRTPVDGYWFLINFDELTAGPAQLFNYTRLLLEFRLAGKPVIAGRVGSFGLALMATGITGFSSGMTSLENFSWHYFTDRSNMSGGQQRYFLSQILQNVTITAADTILRGPLGGEFACPCPACVGSTANRLSWTSARVHLLYSRQTRIEALMRTAPEHRIALVRRWVAGSIELAQRLDAIGVRVRRDHLQTWLNVLGELVQRGLVKAA